MIATWIVSSEVFWDRMIPLLTSNVCALVGGFVVGLWLRKLSR